MLNAISSSHPKQSLPLLQWKAASLLCLVLPGSHRELGAVHCIPAGPDAAAERTPVLSQSCPLPWDLPGGRRELEAICWSPPVVPVQKHRGQQFQSFPFPQSLGRKRMEDREEGITESSSWPRGSLANDDSSMPRWKARAPAAPPTDVATPPGKHDVILLAWA